MKAEKLVKKLVEIYGNRVKVNSPYHIQVSSKKGPHDIWIAKDDTIKFKQAGNRTILYDVNLGTIKQKISLETVTHVEKMREMLNAAEIVKKAEETAFFIGDGIFTDAGWKDGKARIAAIAVYKDEMYAKVKKISCPNINIAEEKAIELGLEFNGNLSIYNDNQDAVNKTKAVYLKASDRIKWLSRKNTKAADKLSNLRKNENPPW